MLVVSCAKDKNLMAGHDPRLSGQEVLELLNVSSASLRTHWVSNVNEDLYYLYDLRDKPLHLFEYIKHTLYIFVDKIRHTFNGNVRNKNSRGKTQSPSSYLCLLFFHPQEPLILGKSGGRGKVCLLWSLYYFL